MHTHTHTHMFPNTQIYVGEGGRNARCTTSDIVKMWCEYIYVYTYTHTHTYMHT